MCPNVGELGRYLCVLVLYTEKGKGQYVLVLVYSEGSVSPGVNVSRGWCVLESVYLERSVCVDVVALG